jgi:hypothetical protein
MQGVFIDTDPGIGDTAAIFLALASPESTIAALTTMVCQSSPMPSLPTCMISMSIAYALPHMTNSPVARWWPMSPTAGRDRPMPGC